MCTFPKECFFFFSNSGTYITCYRGRRGPLSSAPGSQLARPSLAVGPPLSRRQARAGAPSGPGQHSRAATGSPRFPNLCSGGAAAGQGKHFPDRGPRDPSRRSSKAIPPAACRQACLMRLLEHGDRVASRISSA